MTQNDAFSKYKLIIKKCPCQKIFVTKHDELLL